MSGRALRVGAAVLLAIVAACEAAPSPAPTVSVGPSPAPSAGPTSIELHLLDPRYVPAGPLVSANAELLWSAGVVWPSEIWRYIPGAAQPERIFASPRPKSTITSVVGSDSGYAFVEVSEPAFGEGGWRVWYLSGPDADPVQIDQGIAKRAGHPPTITMDEAHVAWAGFDELATGFVSRLAVAPIGDLGRATTLLERPVRESLIWYPALQRNEVWYGTIRGDFDATGAGDEFHIEVIDLAGPDLTPARFAGTGLDFNPAVSERHVVWKTNEAGDNALNWGTVRVLDRRSGAIAVVPIEHANRPSIGDRYVAFEEIFHTRLAVYDTFTGLVFDLAPAGGPSTYGGQSISGRLLTFYTQGPDGTGQARIGWAILPE